MKKFHISWKIQVFSTVNHLQQTKAFNTKSTFVCIESLLPPITCPCLLNNQFFLFVEIRRHPSLHWPAPLVARPHRPAHPLPALLLCGRHSLLPAGVLLPVTAFWSVLQFTISCVAAKTVIKLPKTIFLSFKILINHLLITSTTTTTTSI